MIAIYRKLCLIVPDNCTKKINPKFSSWKQQFYFAHRFLIWEWRVEVMTCLYTIMTEPLGTWFLRLTWWLKPSIIWKHFYSHAIWLMCAVAETSPRAIDRNVSTRLLQCRLVFLTDSLEVLRSYTVSQDSKVSFQATNWRINHILWPRLKKSPVSFLPHSTSTIFFPLPSFFF